MFGLGAFFVLGGFAFLIFFAGYRKTSPSPPFKVNKMFLGRYSKDADGKIILLEGGNRFFFPFFQEPAEFDFSDKNFSASVDEVRTPKDTSDSEVYYEITWHISEKFLEAFLRSSGAVKTPEEKHFKKIQEMLEGIVAETLREFATSDAEGPMTWEEISKMKPETAEKILMRICELSGPSNKDEIAQVRAGNGSAVAKGLGIRIKRLNITKVVPDSTIETAAEEKEVEERHNNAKTVRRNYLVQSVNVVAEETGLSPKESLDALQIDEGRASRQIFTIDQRGGGGKGSQSPIVVLPAPLPNPAAPPQAQSPSSGKKRKGER